MVNRFALFCVIVGYAVLMGVVSLEVDRKPTVRAVYNLAGAYSGKHLSDGGLTRIEIEEMLMFNLLVINYEKVWGDRPREHREGLNGYLVREARSNADNLVNALIDYPSK